MNQAAFDTIVLAVYCVFFVALIVVLPIFLKVHVRRERIGAERAHYVYRLILVSVLVLVLAGAFAVPRIGDNLIEDAFMPGLIAVFVGPVFLFGWLVELVVMRPRDK